MGLRRQTPILFRSNQLRSATCACRGVGSNWWVYGVFNVHPVRTLVRRRETMLALFGQ